MIVTRIGSPLRLTAAAILILAATIVGWLAVRTTAMEIMPSGRSAASAMIAGRPGTVLSTATSTFAANKGSLPSRYLPGVRRAAVAMPLDDRPYLLIGSAALRAGETGRAVNLLEAGRRLDPRQRWIHLLLLERYLRSGNYTAAAEELAVTARLIGAAQGPIAAALAQMSVAPDTRDAVRRTLRGDVSLENSVLGAMASSDVDPAVIFAMASPGAIAVANAPGGWGTVLVNRLVAAQRYSQGRAVWQRINRLSDQQLASPLFDAGFNGLPAKPPFNWTLASGNVAAVDVRNHAVQLDYYGRDGGDLISQLLVLPPGAFRFSHVISGSQQVAGSTLSWTIDCDNQRERQLAQLRLPLNGSAQRRVAVNFTVPSGCPAQRLRLVGAPGEFPTPVSITIERLQLARLGGK